MQKEQMLKNKTTSKDMLCPVQEIPEGEAKGFTNSRGEFEPGIFIVNKNGRLYGYENRCPHTGTPLDWKPNDFLDKDNTYIQCSTHGALFQIEDGLCIHGPCTNQSLAKIDLDVTGGKVYWLKA